MSPVELEYICAGLPVTFPLKEKSAHAQEKCLETERSWRQQQICIKVTIAPSQIDNRNIPFIKWHYSFNLLSKKHQTESDRVILKLPYLLLTHCHPSPYLNSSPFPIQCSAKVPWPRIFKFLSGFAYLFAVDRSSHSTVPSSNVNISYNYTYQFQWLLIQLQQ